MRRILLIENAAEHEHLARSLREDGYEVTEVQGREAVVALLHMLHEHRDEVTSLPDIIIGDAEQSGGPGLDLLIEAQNLREGLPVILLSDAPDVDLQREIERLQPKCVFFSPPEADAVREAARKLC